MLISCNQNYATEIATEQMSPIVSTTSYQDSTVPHCENTPILIPFNKLLFDRYCSNMVDQLITTKTQLDNAFIWSSGLLGVFYAMPIATKLLEAGYFCMNSGIPAYASSIWTAFKGNFDFSTIGLSCGTIMGLGYKTTMFLHYVSGIIQYSSLCTASRKALRAKNYEQEQQTWEIKKIIPLAQQEECWHTIIHERFGKPAVSGHVFEPTPYVLVFQKKYGAGQIKFNPEDKEQIEILLGIHATKKDDLRCDTIEIVPLI
jgi:hypothetical protein